MLDELGLPQASLRWQELLNSPSFSDFTPTQLIREVIEPQYVETMNNRYKTNLRLSRRSIRVPPLRTLSPAASGVITTILLSSCRLSVSRGSIQCRRLRRDRSRKVLFHVGLLQRDLPTEFPLHVHGLLRSHGRAPGFKPTRGSGQVQETSEILRSHPAPVH